MNETEVLINYESTKYCHVKKVSKVKHLEFVVLSDNRILVLLKILTLFIVNLLPTTLKKVDMVI